MDFALDDPPRIRAGDVALPSALRPLLERVCANARPVDYVFARPLPRRHLSPAQVDRIVAATARLADVPGPVDAATLTGTDPRVLQEPVQLLTVLYPSVEPPRPAPTAATMQLGFDLDEPADDGAAACVRVRAGRQQIRLDGIRVQSSTKGSMVSLPPRESWRLAVSALAPAERRRLDDPSFYRLVVFQLHRRFVARRAATSAPPGT